MQSGPAASPRSFDHEAAEFVRFCYRRRRVGWPELYDEMCAVAARGLYRGLDADDLGAMGIGFSLFDMAALAGLANTVVAEEHAKRRPVSVAIVSETERTDVAAREPAGAAALDVSGHSLDAVPASEGARERGSVKGSSLVGAAAST